MTCLASVLLPVALAFGAIGLYLLMPGQRRGRRALGPLLLVMSAGVLLGLLLPHIAGSATRGWFAAFAVLSLTGAVRMITHSKPVYSALYFILVVVSVTGFLVLLNAEFLAAALLLVYAGAILVAYLFVIMLAQQRPAGYDQQAREPLLGCALGFFLLTLLMRGWQHLQGPVSTVPGDFGSPLDVGSRLSTQYVIAVVTLGLLLLAALVAAVAIARARRPGVES